jgi:hypothetical protein
LLTLLDDLIPQYDAASRHSIQVAANPSIVYQLARHADPGRLPLVRLLMGFRVLPGWLSAAACGSRRAGNPATEYSVGAARFTLIAESPGEEFVLGIMGRFWTPTGGVVATNAERFRELPPAGLAQAFWNFRVSRDSRGTELSTETRIRCSDEITRRQFGRYWRIIRPGSSLIRNSILRHIRHAAERAAG